MAGSSLSIGCLGPLLFLYMEGNQVDWEGRIKMYFCMDVNVALVESAVFNITMAKCICIKGMPIVKN